MASWRVDGAISVLHRRTGREHRPVRSRPSSPFLIGKSYVVLRLRSWVHVGPNSAIPGMRRMWPCIWWYEKLYVVIAQNRMINKQLYIVRVYQMKMR